MILSRSNNQKLCYFFELQFKLTDELNCVIQVLIEIRVFETINQKNGILEFLH